MILLIIVAVAVVAIRCVVVVLTCEYGVMVN
jgi:hypothetical protein